ncbi:cation diffusion facilitator family transporter [Holzapfeliella sp. JNUCC 80]
MIMKSILGLIDKKTSSLSTIDKRSKTGTYAGIVGLILNIILVAIKLTVGLISGSVAIMADAINSLSDAGSSVLTLVGFHISGKRPDTGHPYGHQRFEDISGLIIAVVMLIVGVQFVYESVGKIISPTEIDLSLISLIFLVVSFVIKLWQAVFYYRLGNKLKSKTLIATGVDSRNDLITTGSIIFSSALFYFLNINIDSYLALVVAVFIVYSSYKLIAESINLLMGSRPEDELLEKVDQQLMSYKNILGYHDLMVHEYGPNRIYAVIDIELDSTLSLDKAHEIVDRIERDFGKKFNINLVAHMDPIDIRSRKATHIMQTIREVINSYETNLKIHDFHVETLKNNDHLIQFDIVVPNDSPLTDDEWLVEINHALRKRLGDVTVQINFDHTNLGVDRSLI